MSNPIGDLIRRKQAEVPTHLRGYLHNVDDKTTLQFTEKMAKETGCELWLGDLWVHEFKEGPGMGKIAIGYVTRAGEIAIHRWAARFEQKSWRTSCT